MKTYLRNLFESVSQSLWLMPAVSIAMAMAAAYGMLRWESGGLGEWENLPLINRSSRETSLAIVGAIVGSLITVAGVTFSITIVSLTLASSQFGPRLLRNFLQSRSSQLTLGALIGSFVYGILIMPAMDEGWEAGHAHPSVTLMILLACVCVCLIVHYIHHVATSIQADALVASVYRELERKIDGLSRRESVSDGNEAPDWGKASESIVAERSGYITAYNYQGLLAAAEEADLKVRLPLRPGHFVARGECVAEIFGKGGAEETNKRIYEAIFIGDKRTPEQNMEFLVDQLVEVALRAMSPGINDPNTAIVCIDYLAGALCQVSSRELDSCYREDDSGEKRVFCQQTDYEGLVDDAFNQLRQMGANYPEVTIRLIDSLSRISDTLQPYDIRQQALRNQFEQIAEIVENAKADLASKDLDDIEAAMKRFRSF